MKTTARQQDVERLVSSGVARREFAKRMIAGGAAAYGVATFAGSADLLAQQVTDFDVLNFALNLEYLEAEFYTVATTGQRIQEAGIAVSGKGRSGATTGGSKVALDDRTMSIAQAITQDEQAHVRFLRAALGNQAVAKPSINLAALGIGFNNQAEFLTLAAIFEDVGVSAYAGAAMLIDNSKFLGAAAQIALTEGQHAGLLRLLASDNKLNVPPVDGKAVPPLGQPNGRLFFVDANGLSPMRTAGEVLNIVYAGRRDGGGFFPDRVNGVIEKP